MSAYTHRYIRNIYIFIYTHAHAYIYQKHIYIYISEKKCISDCFWWLKKGVISNSLNHTFFCSVLFILPLHLPWPCFNTFSLVFSLYSNSDSFSDRIT